MKINKNDQSRRKRSDAAGTGSQNVAAKAKEKIHLQYSMRTQNSSQKDNTSKQNHNEPTIIETLSQTADSKKRPYRSSLVKIRKKRRRSKPRVRSTSAKSSAASSGKYIRQRKRMDNTSDDDGSNLSGGAVKNVKKEKKRERKIVHGDGHSILEDGSTSAKPSDTGSGKYIRQRKRMDNTSDDDVSIQTDSDSSGGAVKNIKKEKKMIGGNIVHGSDPYILKDDSPSSKSSTSGSEKYIRQRKRNLSNDSSDEEKGSFHQTDSDRFFFTAKVIKKQRRLNSVLIRDDVSHDDSKSSTSTPSVSEKYVRKRSDDSSEDEEVCIQYDSDSSDSSVEYVKRKKKKGRNIEHGDGQNILSDGSTSAKPCASCNGKYVRQHNRNHGGKCSIQTNSDSAGGCVKNIKKKKRERNPVHGDGQDVLNNDSKSAKPSATGSGKYIERCNYSSYDEKIITQHQNVNKTNRESKIVDSDDQNVVSDGTKRGKFLSDFDFMRERKKAENVHRRKRNNAYDMHNNEALIELLEQMKQAALQDRQLNLDGKPATKKIAILKKVMNQLIKKDLQHTLLSHNVLHVLAEWIAPLPNKALPCLQIRESILKLLIDFPLFDKLYLKESGIGKAVMYLYKHPCEIKVNRKRANVLIARWFRSIYNIKTDFSGMSLEERRERDLEQLPMQPKPWTQEVVPSKATFRSDFLLIDTNKNSIRPGEKGWISRARVPLPSDKVYIIRPKSRIETSLSIVPKKQKNRYEMYMRKFNDNKRKNTTRSPVFLSIEGRKC